MQPKVKLYTPEEYLALEEKSPVKNEYFQGRIYQMTGASMNHNTIISNLSGYFFPFLNKKSCRHFMGYMRVLVKTNGLYTYPDFIVVCGPVERADSKMDTLTNPLVIFEVLSDSTSEYDRTEKIELYKGLESLKNYVLVDQHRPYIQVFNRLETEQRLWVLETFSSLEIEAYFPAIDTSLSLADIYSLVEWPETPGEHPQRPN